MSRRVTTRPVILGGVALPAGAKPLLWLAAAGGDEAIFRTRGASTPSATTPGAPWPSAGIHFCIGSALGRLEAALALEG